MSLQSWQDEFYPVEADQPQTQLDAARHSLQKWQGVMKKNLKRHGLTLNRFLIRPEIVHASDDDYEALVNLDSRGGSK